MASGVDGKGETLYLKVERSVLKFKPQISLKDVGSLECANREIWKRLQTLPIYQFRHPGNMSCTTTRIVQEIHKVYPKLQVVTLGEPEILFEYRSKGPSKVGQYAKLTLVCFLLFFGAAFTIMAFHNDIGITDVFSKFYYQVVGQEKPKLSALEISYSIGLVLGITGFYNHFFLKKLTHDPTPVQVELRKFEKDMDMTIMENASRRKENMDVS